MKSRLAKNNVTAGADFANQLLAAASELDSALVHLTAAYRGYEQYKKQATMTDAEYQEFMEIAEGIEHQFRQFTVKADEIELKTCAEQMVEFVNKIGG